MTRSRSSAIGRLGGEITSSNLPGLSAAVKLRLLIALLAALNRIHRPLLLCRAAAGCVAT